MKSKITFLLTSFLMLMLGIGSSRAEVGDVLTSLSQISNSKYYTITAPRGGLTLNAKGTGVVSSKKSNGTVDNADASTAANADKWAILSHDGVSYYLYNVENKSVLNADGSMSNNLSEALELMLASNPTGNYVFKIKKGTNTLNNNNAGNFVLDAWSSEDGGNRLTIVEAGDFDASILDNLTQITFNVVDGQDNIVATETIPRCIKGETYTPSFASLKGITLANGSVVAGESDQTCSTTFSVDESAYPFKFSASSAKGEASWYMLKVNRTPAKYCQFDGTSIKATTELNETSFSQATAFCFVGTPFGFKIVNAAHRDQAFGPKATSANGLLTNGSVDEAATFVFENSSEAGYTSFQLLRNVTDPIGYVNDMTAGLSYWLSTSNRHDAGSNFSFISIPEDAIDIPTDFVVDGIKYLVNADGKSVSVTYPTEAEPTQAAPNTYTGDIVIPDEVTYGTRTYTVTAIGRAAFTRSTITSLTIGDNVTETGYDCCAYTSTLAKVVIGSGVTRMNQGFSYSCSNLKDVTIKATTPPAIGSYIFSANPTITVKVTALAAYKAASAWSGYNYVGGTDFDFTYNELQSLITSYDNKYTAGTNPGTISEASVNAINEAVASAKSVAEDADQATVNSAVKTIAEAINNMQVNNFEEGKLYYVVSAGNGPGYSNGPYNYEYKNALYNANGFVSWKAWDKNDFSQIYRFTSAGDGKWYLYSISDESYINKGTGSYGCKVTTTATPTNGQTFTLVGNYNGKYAFTGATYVYALNASHNGSANATGDLNIWGSVGEAAQYGVNQWFVIPVADNITEYLEAKDALIAYTTEVEANYAKMTDATYDDAALTAEVSEAISSKLTECKDAINSTTATAQDYTDLLASLKEAYEKAPFIEGGITSSAMTVADITDGSKIILEVGHSNYKGKYMVAYADNDNGNSVMCDDADKKKATVWVLEATGSNDAIYTDKPTYYMKDQASGKYFGATSTTSLEPTAQRLVSGTDNAFAFSFLTADEIKAKENVDLNLYGVESPVFVQHSNADGTWFRLARFGAYTNVYRISSSYYPTNKDWQTWNLTSGNSSYNIAAELADALTQYGNITIPNIGSDPGCIDSAVVVPFLDAIKAAKAITSANTRKEYRTAIDNITSTYAATKAATVNPIIDGYYFIESAWTSKAGQHVVAYDPNDGSNALANHINANSAYDIFQLTTIGEGQYTLKNLGSGLYVGQAGASENKITLVETAPEDVYQKFTYDTDGQYKWADNATTFTYHINQASIGRYYTQTTGGFDAWYLRTVPQELVDEILNPVEVKYYEIATEPSAPIEGKTYVIKNVTTGLYATTKGAVKDINVLNSDAIWSIKKSQLVFGDENYPSYSLKSEGNDGYWQEDDFTTGATEGAPLDGFELHKNAGLNATFGSLGNAQLFTIVPATAYAEEETFSSIGKDKTPVGYVIAAAFKITSGTFSKYYKLDIKGDQVALDPHLNDVDWEFYEAVKGTDINRELELAKEAYKLTEELSIGNDPGQHSQKSQMEYNDAMAEIDDINTVGDAPKDKIRRAIDNLAVCYNSLMETNPIIEGYYAIVSAGKGSGHPFSDEVKYDDQNKYAMYNNEGIVSWKAYSKTAYDEIYYLSSDGKGNWYVKNVADNSYINKGTGSYNCNITTTAEPVTAQTFNASYAATEKFAINNPMGQYAYALTASHNGAGTNTEGNVNIWGSIDEANKGKMNLWYLHSVDEETLTAAKEAYAATLGDVIAEYRAKTITSGQNPGMVSESAVNEFVAALDQANEVASTGTTEQKINAIAALKADYVKCINTIVPFVDGNLYYVVCDNEKIAQAGKADKAMYIDPLNKSVRWAQKVEGDDTYAFKVSVNADGTYTLQNVKTGLYAGSATAFCGVVPSSETPANLTFHSYNGTGSFYIKGEKVNNIQWTYCPKGNAAGTSDGPNDVWAYNGEGTSGGNAPHKEWTWRFEPFVQIVDLEGLIAEVEGTTIEASDKPGYYSQANVDSLAKALTAAKGAIEGTEDEKLAAYNELKAIFNKATSEINPITEGCYYIVSKYQAYEDNFGAPAAMYVAPANKLESGLSTVRYEKYDKTNAHFIFKFTKKDGVDGGFNVYSLADKMYLNTGDGDNWYGETTTASQDAVNAQIFRSYGIGQFWVCDETDKLVSRSIRDGNVQNANLFGWTQYSDVVPAEKTGYNAWELIPIDEMFANTLVERQAQTDLDAQNAYAALETYAESIKATYERYVSDDSGLNDQLKEALTHSFDQYTAYKNSRAFDITTRDNEYTALKQSLEELMETARLELSGINGIAGGNGTVNAVNGGITVTADHDMTLTVVSTSGAVVAKQSLKAGETYTVSLTPGIYVANGKKLVVK